MKKGFTLVELIISFVILTLFLGGVFYALSAELRFWHLLANQAASQQRFDFLASRLTRDIRSADLILPSSSQTTLCLQLGSDIIFYTLINNKIRRQKGTSPAYLTEAGEISALLFTYPNAKLVEISLDGQTLLAGVRR